MKKLMSVIIGLVVFASILHGQTQPYKVVFDLTNSDTAMHSRLLRWINSILASNAGAEIEVVYYGQSLGMVTKGQSTVAAEVERILKMPQVTFSVCEQAMKAHKISKDQLIPGVKTVPDGIYAIITREAQGFGYIKVTM